MGQEEEIDLVGKLEESKHSLYITHSGHHFDMANISENDIILDDIAHGLVKECRYGQAMDLDRHYSVCQHSLALCNYALNVLEKKDLARLLLMHDASEAYLGDIPNGLKSLLPDYIKLEEKVTNVILSKYKIKKPDYLDELLIKELDTRILLDEACLFVPKHTVLFDRTLERFTALNFTRLQDEDNDYKFQLKQLFMETADFLGVRDE
jgi:hypothetical protein